MARNDVGGKPIALPLASCRLDERRLETQLGRYGALAAHVSVSRREPQRVTVEFGAGADIELLRETVAVERECCSLFEIHLDERARTLAVGVTEPAMVPSLDAIAHSLGV
jgi:hypothetical protein